MNRRGFLGVILAAGIAPAFVRPSSLMRISPIVLPTVAESAAIASGNRLMTMQEITRDALAILHQKLAFVQTVNRDYDFMVIRK